MPLVFQHFFNFRTETQVKRTPAFSVFYLLQYDVKSFVVLDKISLLTSRKDCPVKKPGSPFIFLYSFVFFPGSKAASDMTFGFVEFKNLFDLKVQRPVDVFKPLGKIFMFGCH